MHPALKSFCRTGAVGGRLLCGWGGMGPGGRGLGGGARRGVAPAEAAWAGSRAPVYKDGGGCCSRGAKNSWCLPREEDHKIMLLQECSCLILLPRFCEALLCLEMDVMDKVDTMDLEDC